jgi:hypothetical protein
LSEDEADKDGAENTPWSRLKLAVNNEMDSLLNLLLNEVEVHLDQDLYNVEECPIDPELEKLWYWDFERLGWAQTELSCKVKDVKLTVVLHSWIASMVGTLNLYLNETLLSTWRQALELTSKAQGKGTSYAQSVHTWIHAYLDNTSLPHNNYGTTNTSLLTNEDFTPSIQLYLLERLKRGYMSRILPFRPLLSFFCNKFMQFTSHSTRKPSKTS